MPIIPEFTAKYIMTSEDGYFRFKFCCGICENTFVTGRISAASADEAFKLAANEGRNHFNRCYQCKRWVCDWHYNEDEMVCEDCAPRVGNNN